LKTQDFPQPEPHNGVFPQKGNHPKSPEKSPKIFGVALRGTLPNGKKRENREEMGPKPLTPPSTRRE